MQHVGTLVCDYASAKIVNHRDETKFFVEDVLRPMDGWVVTVREFFDEEGSLDAVMFLRESHPSSHAE